VGGGGRVSGWSAVAPWRVWPNGGIVPMRPSRSRRRRRWTAAINGASGVLVVASVVAVIEIEAPVATNLGIAVAPTSTSHTSEAQVLENPAVPSWAQAQPSHASRLLPALSLSTPTAFETSATNSTVAVTTTAHSKSVSTTTAAVAAAPSPAPATVSAPGAGGRHGKGGSDAPAQAAGPAGQTGPQHQSGPIDLGNQQAQAGPNSGDDHGPPPTPGGPGPGGPNQAGPNRGPDSGTNQPPPAGPSGPPPGPDGPPPHPDGPPNGPPGPPPRPH
jgi:hypothetical protein